MSSSVFVHIVDDDEAVRESLADLLRSMDYQEPIAKLLGPGAQLDSR